MNREEQLQDVCRKIIADFHPQKLILFGSEARGTARPDSDVDLLVIMPFSGSPIKQAASIYKAIQGRTIPVDIVLRTPEDVAWRVAEGDSFICGILMEGRTVHEAHYA